MIHSLKVKLISPAIIGGADSRNLDNPPVFRPPEIRGQLRFWTRALAGGARMSIKEIKKEENLFFGSEENGQRITFLSPEIIKIVQKRMKPLPHKNFRTNIIPQGETVIRIRFKIPRMEDSTFKKFQAVLWIWLHLGSIGRRARRGFGSLLWIRDEEDILSGFINFDQNKVFDSKTALQDYLMAGLKEVEKVWGVPSSSNPRVQEKFFCLSYIDQVFIGEIFHDSNRKIIDQINDSPDGIIARMHGLNKNTTGDHKELGHTGWLRGTERRLLPKKLASPMMWRLFPCGKGYIPVMTWSPLSTTKVTQNTDVHNYLANKLGFTHSLMGNPL